MDKKSRCWKRDVFFNEGLRSVKRLLWEATHAVEKSSEKDQDYLPGSQMKVQHASGLACQIVLLDCILKTPTPSISSIKKMEVM